MINIDLSWAIACIMFFMTLLVFSSWVFYNLNNDKNLKQGHKDVCQCPYCTSIFVNSDEKKTVICPQCKSLIKVEEAENAKAHPQ